METTEMLSSWWMIKESGKCYSAIKGDKLLTHEIMWMYLKSIKLSEICQAQETTYYMISFIYNSWEVNSIVIVSGQCLYISAFWNHKNI